MKILSQLCHHKGRSAASRAEMLTVFLGVLGCPSHQSHHKVQALATRSHLQGTPFCSFCLMWGFTIWQQCPHILLKASEHCKRNNFPCHRMSPGTYFLTQESQGRKDEQNWDIFASSFSILPQKQLPPPQLSFNHVSSISNRTRTVLLPPAKGARTGLGAAGGHASVRVFERRAAASPCPHRPGEVWSAHSAGVEEQW